MESYLLGGLCSDIIMIQENINILVALERSFKSGIK